MPIRDQIGITDRGEIFTENSESDSENQDDEELSPVMDHLFLVSYNNIKGIDVQNCIWQGLDCIDFSQYEEAIKIFNKGLKCDPDISDFWLFKAICYSEMKSPVDAMECLKKGNWEVYLDHAFRLYRNSQFRKALRYFENGIKINPSDPDLWDNKGTCLEQLGRSDAAVNCYEHAKELDLLRFSQ